MAVQDLQGCAKLLGNIMLENDCNLSSKKSVKNLQSIKAGSNKVKKLKPTKVQCRKSGNPVVKVHKLISPDIDDLEDSLQEYFKMKQSKIDIPEKDQAINLSDIGAPYNQRLASSTPQQSPKKNKASVEALLKGDADDHALNSFEFVQLLNPQATKLDKGPMLKQGQVEFKPNPLQSMPPRSAFMQQHLQGMHQAYMLHMNTNKQPVTNPKTTTYPQQTTQKDNYESAKFDHIEGLPSTIPAPIVLGNKQVLYPQPIIVTSGANGTYSYNFPQGMYNSQYVYQPSVLYSNEPPEKDTAQFSLYSADDSENKEFVAHSNQQTGANLRKASKSNPEKKLTTDEIKSRKPITPFKYQSKNECGKNMATSRAEILKSALKIALDENGKVKTGPVSPFKPGIKGYSGFGQESSNQSEDNSTCDQESSAGMSDNRCFDEIGVQTECFYAESEDIDSTIVETPRVCEQHGQSSKKIADKSTNSSKAYSRPTKSAEMKKVVMKNKKVQFVPGKKKSKDGKVKKNGVNSSKAAGKSNKALTNKEISPKGKTAEKSKFPSEKPSKENVLEENKENVIPEGEGQESIVGNVEQKGMMGSVEDGLTLLKKVQYLVRELKAVPGMKLDKEGKRLLKELDDSVHKGQLTMQTDLDLMLQPMRSENSQLRRRIRILTQQVKEKERDLENAVKPDTNFTVVHLQMKVYNLENEITALKQLNTKLKEEVQVYLLEVEKLSSEKAEMLDLFGKKSPNKDETLKKMAEISCTKTELEAYKRQKREWDRDKDELIYRTEHMRIQCNQKDEELLKIKELVKSLQSSMAHLLEDLQSNKPCPSSSMTRLNNELIHVEDIMTKMTKQEPKPMTKGPLKAQHDKYFATYKPERPSARSRVPDVMSRTLRSASADRMLIPDKQKEADGKWHEKVMHQGYYQGHRSRSHQRLFDDQNEVGNQGECNIVHLNIGSSKAENRRYDFTEGYEPEQRSLPDYERKSTREKDLQTHNADRIPSTNSNEKVGLFLMDEPGLNYKRMAENLSDGQRVSISTYPETDLTEYQMYPGMSPIKGQAFEKLDPFIKDLIKSQRIRTSPGNMNNNKASKDELTHSKQPNADDKYHSKRNDVFLSPDSRDAHQSKDNGKDLSSRVSESKETISSAPTVKELLTPLADRMERFKSLSEVEKSRAVRAINFDQPPAKVAQPTSVPSGKNPNTVDLDDSYHIDLEGEIDKLQYEASSEDGSGTFSEKSDQVVVVENKPRVEENRTINESRYSVTDYFKKYPKDQKVYRLVRNNGNFEKPTDTSRNNQFGFEPTCYNPVLSKQNENWSKQEQEQLKLDLSSFQHKSSDEDSQDGRHVAVDGFDPPVGLDKDYWAQKIIMSPHGIPMIFDDSQDEDDKDSTGFHSNCPIVNTNRSAKELQLTEFENISPHDVRSQSLYRKGGATNQISPQQKLYTGTDLDTSLSSINEMESVGTATTSASISSVEDRVFRQGLANLDANIARVQQSLRQKLY